MLFTGCVGEGLFARVFKLIGVDLPLPFPRFTYAEAMRRWGSDKPDLRIQGMELHDLSPSLEGTDFAPYAAALAAGTVIGKTIVLTGAMIPYAFGSSDGLFNLGSALSFAQVLPPGVYIAMNGQHFPWHAVRKNKAAGVFEAVAPKGAA